MLKDIVTLRLWRNGRRAVMMLSLLVGMAATSTAGCAGGPPSEEITAPADSLAATVTSIPADTDTPARTAVPSPTFVPTHSPTGELSPAGVYERVAPSVAFIETPRATGSGVLIRDGYVITNYHVVWPYGSVQVVFPDGTELEDVPIVGWDPMVDLAVLGPVDVSAHPLPLRDAEKDSALGSDLFLIGYPAEVDLLPKPTITSGILSRTREWERPGITYFQTDAAIEGGQSGGALVNSRGLVVGISTFWFSDAGFALAASSADVIPIVEQLIQGEFRSGLGARRLPLGRGNFEFSLDLRNPWEARDFLLDGPAGTMLQVEIEGPGDGWFRVSDVFETILGVNDGLTGAESGAVELSTGGIHILQVGLDWGDPSRFSLSSNLRLRPLSDPDDGRLVTVGETVAASLDHFSDWDWYSIRLKEGETVRISTDSFNVDTLIAVDFPDSRRNQVVSDDDGGGGLFGLNSELVYRAPHSGEYIIAVTDAAGENFGGYYLSVVSAAPGTETVAVPPGPQMVDSRFGTMLVFDSPSGYFSIQVPEAWVELELDEASNQVFSAYDPGTDSYVFVVEEDVLPLGRGELSLKEYAEVLESALITRGAENITSQPVQTVQGLAAMKMGMSTFTHRGVWLIYLLDNNLAFNISYTFPLTHFAAGQRLAEYSFETLRVNQRFLRISEHR